MKKLILLTIVALKTLAANAQWQQTNEPYRGNIPCLAITGTDIFAATLDSGIYLSTNNGANWMVVNSGLTSLSVLSFSFIGTNIFAGTEYGVFLSTDTGANWTAIDSGLPSYYGHPTITSFTTIGANIFTGTSQYGVFLSIDTGRNWSAVNSGLTNLYLRSLALMGTNIFAGTTNGGVFLSNNNGASWTAVNNGLTGNGLYVLSLVVSGTNIFEGTSGGGVFLSTDTGASWTAINNGLPDSADIFSLAISGTNIFATTWGRGIFLSTNNGGSWTAFNEGLTDPYVHSLAVSGTTIYAGTGQDSGTVWKRSLSDILGVENISAVNSNVSIYPNPATNQLTIHTSSFHNEAVTVLVTNMLGQEALPPTVLFMKDKDTIINIDKLSVGMYFIRVKSKSGSVIRKFVKD